MIDITSIRIFSVTALVNGTVEYKIDVPGTPTGRFYDTNDISRSQKTLIVHQNNVIQGGEDFSPVLILNGYPTRVTWKQLIQAIEEQYQDPTTRIFGCPQLLAASDRWLEDDQYHKCIIWNGTFNEKRFLIRKKWITNPGVNGEIAPLFHLAEIRNHHIIVHDYDRSLADVITYILPDRLFKFIPPNSEKRRQIIDELKAICPDWSAGKTPEHLSVEWQHHCHRGAPEDILEAYCPTDSDRPTEEQELIAVQLMLENGYSEAFVRQGLAAYHTHSEADKIWNAAAQIVARNTSVLSKTTKNLAT
ncbi:hypothetical protein ACQ4M3_13155 [Leptolyngbya sp. AN03gr2]|uniref:hypothetical protein n=1 Tax=unclassified Leptolyngbya TaxID=2650499 RepID=UPI003D315A23